MTYRELRHKEAIMYWNQEYRENLDDAKKVQAELHRLDLLVNAYENKLKTCIDPDSKQWAAAWDKLQMVKNERRACAGILKCIKHYGKLAEYNSTHCGINGKTFNHYLMHEGYTGLQDSLLDEAYTDR